MVLFGEGDSAAPVFAPKFMGDLADEVRGKDIVFVTHGFNVPLNAGFRSIARFASRLSIPEETMIVGVVWPGDFHIPYFTSPEKSIGINYPVASTGAIGAGRSLGDLCNGPLSGVRSISLVSHSLGALVVLEAAKRLHNKAKLLCITAGAVNDDCLSTEYSLAADQAATIRVLASTMDWVLQVLFRLGDPVSQVLDQLPGPLGPDDHKPFEMALGRLGPHPELLPPVYRAQIPESEYYGHGNYLAPSDDGYRLPPAAMAPLSDTNKWLKVAGFVSAAVNGASPSWPPQYIPNQSLRPWFWPFQQWRWPLA
jgi:hypothetical protein